MYEVFEKMPFNLKITAQFLLDISFFINRDFNGLKTMNKRENFVKHSNGFFEKKANEFFEENELTPDTFAFDGLNFFLMLIPLFCLYVIIDNQIVLLEPCGNNVYWGNFDNFFVNSLHARTKHVTYLYNKIDDINNFPESLRLCFYLAGYIDNIDINNMFLKKLIVL